jgi:SPRY domain
MPGWNRYSIAYHSNGDKSYNYPFTTTPFGPILREGDVLGVGYRPRTGTVFFTRNGRKTEEAFAGLSRWNLFPTVGADGPCSVHVNLGQAGFVFIEANVKKWGLAPSVGTLAPPPAYGSERGSILLEAGGGTPHSRLSPPPTPGATTSNSRRPSGNRPRRARGPPGSTVPAVSSPLRNAPLSPPPPFSPGETVPRQGIFSRLQISASSSSATGTGPSRPGLPSSNSSEHTIRNADTSTSRPTLNLQESRESLSGPDSPFPPNPPTPNVLDIHLRTLDSRPASSGHTTPQPERERLHVQTTTGDSTSEVSDTDGSDEGVSPSGEGHGRREDSERITTSDPPAYAPINPHIYSEGVHIDLPAEIIQAALEGRSPSPAVNGTRGRR